MDISEELSFEERLQVAVKKETARIAFDLEEARDARAEMVRELEFYKRFNRLQMGPPEWTVKPRDPGVKKHVAIVAAQLTDTHFDEIVRPEEVDFINAYNREIAIARLKKWVEKTIVITRDYVKGVDIEGIWVPATGDILSGDIHAELKQSNEDHLYASAVFWIDQLHAALSTLVEEFGALHVSAVVGNHGRSTLKPVFKGRAKSNIEWLMWTVLAQRFSGDSRVTFDVGESMDQTVQIYETTYLLTHGDQFRGGSGISGALAPLMLGQHRKNLRQMATDHPMDMMVMGHFHQYFHLPGLIVGGSMKGYDEYAFGGNFRPEPARQALWITTPERGPTIHTHVDLQYRDKEGW